MKKIISLFLSLGLISAPAAALAETGAGVGIKADVEARAGMPTGAGEVHATMGAGTGVRAGGEGDLHARAKDRAHQEIERRWDNLNQLKLRFDEMARLSPEEKVKLEASLTAQINALTALKARIDADTSTSTLKEDIQSITKGYRVYALVLPQARIAASADRIKTVVGQMQTLGTKLQARIDASTSTDKTAFVTAQADMQAKLTDASAQASAAVTATANLTPDNGDAAVAKANEAALKGARAQIEAATKDLKDARKDVETILKGLKIWAKGSAEVESH